eukprot:CAMPEP_0183300130 /NCGR_PEP_ID=MMETSP0160_2-20130417/6656_1 /TAXON_ID=2839 ORGANISM="Odontella Sinensis, Strain Grunow 1884" /NCGR_SAMPLE_ID=MMETSP0160_2 /ASSEMBLY_ACC=CAM_ASM_000250 /LENGTH=151 /DNA_ID=CAMNT_0025462495 /DNA_START=22 /DNA_END=477 /DNA_ORIENTATION=-
MTLQNHPLLTDYKGVSFSMTSISSEIETVQMIDGLDRLSLRANKADTDAKALRLTVFVIIRVLLKLLEREDPNLRRRAVQALHYCSHKKKEGHPEFRYQSLSFCRVLRSEVGERWWKRAKEHSKIIALSKRRAHSLKLTHMHATTCLKDLK